MRKLSFALLMVCAFAVSASAQMKLSGKETFGKPDTMQSVDVGDKPGHALMIAKGSSTWNPGFEILGLKAVSSVFASTSEGWGSNFTEHGYDTVTMDDGDTITAKYSGTITVAKDGSMTFHGTWTFASATGKLQGVSGSGTYGGTAAADGTGSTDVRGTYTAAKPTMKVVPAAKPAPAS